MGPRRGLPEPPLPAWRGVPPLLLLLRRGLPPAAPLPAAACAGTVMMTEPLPLGLPLGAAASLGEPPCDWASVRIELKCSEDATPKGAVC